jgi:hypothetical protein
MGISPHENQNNFMSQPIESSAYESVPQVNNLMPNISGFIGCTQHFQYMSHNQIITELISFLQNLVSAFLYIS